MHSTERATQSNVHGGAHLMKLASSTNMGARLPSSSCSLVTYLSPLTTLLRCPPSAPSSGHPAQPRRNSASDLRTPWQETAAKHCCICDTAHSRPHSERCANPMVQADGVCCKGAAGLGTFVEASVGAGRGVVVVVHGAGAGGADVPGWRVAARQALHPCPHPLLSPPHSHLTAIRTRQHSHSKHVPSRNTI